MLGVFVAVVEGFVGSFARCCFVDDVCKIGCKVLSEGGFGVTIGAGRSGVFVIPPDDVGGNVEVIDEEGVFVSLLLFSSNSEVPDKGSGLTQCEVVLSCSVVELPLSCGSRGGIAAVAGEDIDKEGEKLISRRSERELLLEAFVVLLGFESGCCCGFCDCIALRRELPLDGGGATSCPGLGRGTELAIFTDEPPPLEGGARRVDDALGFSIPGGGFNGSKLAAPIRPGGKDFDLSAIETEAVGAAGVGTIIALAGC